MTKAKWLLAAALMGGLGWASVEVEVAGKTAYERFADAGGEKAASEAWAWLAGRFSAGLDRAGGWVSDQSAQLWASTREGFEAWVKGWFDDPPAAARATSDAPPKARPAPSRPAAPAPQRSARTAVANPGGTHEVEALAAAAARGPIAAPEASPVDRPRTRVDPRIAPEERAALDAKLSRALGK